MSKVSQKLFRWFLGGIIVEPRRQTLAGSGNIDSRRSFTTYEQQYRDDVVPFIDLLPRDAMLARY